MSTLQHAEKEIEILLQNSPDPNNRPIIEPFIPEILALVKKFGESGQSGGSAPYTASAISQAVKSLCLHETICPIWGDDDEWGEITDGVYQNKREYGVFKDEVHKPYYIDAIVWKTQKGITWSGRAFKKDGSKINTSHWIKSFPFTPKTFVIDVIEEEVAKDDWEFYIKDEEQLKEVWEYYDEKIPTEKKRSTQSNPIDNTPTSPNNEL